MKSPTVVPFCNKPFPSCRKASLGSKQGRIVLLVAGDALLVVNHSVLAALPGTAPWTCWWEKEEAKTQIQPQDISVILTKHCKKPTTALVLNFYFEPKVILCNLYITLRHILAEYKLLQDKKPLRRVKVSILLPSLIKKITCNEIIK